MESKTGDEVYGNWMDNWRKWKFSWCESNEPLITFYIRFICKNGQYTDDEYADLAEFIGTSIGKTSIDRDGVINIHSNNIGSVVSLKIIKHDGKYIDKFGIVTLKLNMFLRKYIIILSKTLEFMGYGVIHNSGQIVSNDYSSNFMPCKMPSRDDPIWGINHHS